ncbi:MAG: hypothetical protein WCL28_13465, partial [bacterium]
ASGGSAPLVVRVTQGGLPVRGVQVQFTVGTGSGSLRAADAAAATSTPVSITTNANGNASAVYLAGAGTGSAGVTATLGGGGGASSVNFFLTIAKAVVTYTYGSSDSGPYDIAAAGSFDTPNTPRNNPFEEPTLWVDEKYMHAAWEKWTDSQAKQFSRSFGGISHSWHSAHEAVIFPATQTDQTDQIVKRFNAEPSRSFISANTQGFPQVLIAYYQHDYQKETQGPWYQPTSESEWLYRSVHALKVVTYVPQKVPAEMTFLALVYQGDSAWLPNSGDPRGQLLASGLIHVKGSASTWSPSLKAYCSLKDEAVIVDPGPEGKRLIGKTDNKHIRVELLRVGLVDSKDETLDNGNDVIVQFKKDSDDKSPQTVAWIDPHGAPNEEDPEMPWLVLRVRVPEQMGLKIKWKLKVEYKRPNGRKLDEDKIEIPDAAGWVTESLDKAVEIYDNTKWKNEIGQKGFFGGEAELTFQILNADGSALGKENKWNFYIGGKNPDEKKTKTFIIETATTVQQPMAWFVYAIAKHESRDYNGLNSRYNQFWDNSGRFAKVDHHGGEVLWVNNPDEDPPKGFGMFQVTGNKSDESANIPRKQLWNWQDNVMGGLDIIASKRSIANRYFARIQRRSAAHKAAYQADPPPNIPVGSHIFSSADAVQIYGYNGTGSYENKPATIDIRYPFDPNKPPGLGSTKRWFWNPHNVKGGEPYINKIERELK